MSWTRFNPNSRIEDLGYRAVTFCREADPKEMGVFLNEVLETYKAKNWRGKRAEVIKQCINQLTQANAKSPLEVVQELINDETAGVDKYSYITLLLRALIQKDPEVDTEIEFRLDNIPLLRDEFLKAIPKKTANESLQSQEEEKNAQLQSANEALQLENLEREKELKELKQQILEAREKIARQNLIFLNLLTKVHDLNQSEADKLEDLRELSQEQDKKNKELDLTKQAYQELKEEVEAILEELHEKKSELEITRQRYLALNEEVDINVLGVDDIQDARAYAKQLFSVRLIENTLRINRKKRDAQERMQQTQSRIEPVEEKPTVPCSLQLMYGQIPPDEAITESNRIYLYYRTEDDSIEYAVKGEDSIARIKISKEALRDEFELIRNILKDSSTKRILTPQSRKMIFDETIKQGYSQKVDVTYIDPAHQVRLELYNISGERSTINTEHVKKVLGEMHQLARIKDQKAELENEKMEQQSKIEDVQEQQKKVKREKEKQQNLSKLGVHATVNVDAWKTVSVEQSYYQIAEKTVHQPSELEEAQIREEQMRKRSMVTAGLQSMFSQRIAKEVKTPAQDALITSPASGMSLNKSNE